MPPELAFLDTKVPSDQIGASFEAMHKVGLIRYDQEEKETFKAAGVAPVCENTSVPIGGNVSGALEAPHSASEGVSGGEGGFAGEWG